MSFKILCTPLAWYASIHPYIRTYPPASPARRCRRRRRRWFPGNRIGSTLTMNIVIWCIFGNGVTFQVSLREPRSALPVSAHTHAHVLLPSASLTLTRTAPCSAASAARLDSDSTSTVLMSTAWLFFFDVCICICPCMRTHLGILDSTPAACASSRGIVRHARWMNSGRPGLPLPEKKDSLPSREGSRRIFLESRNQGASMYAPRTLSPSRSPCQLLIFRLQVRRVPGRQGGGLPCIRRPGGTPS